MVVCVGGDNEFCVLVKKKDLADPSVAPVVAPELEHDQSQRDDVQRRLMMASILCLIFLIAEIAGGLISGSLAILSDAAHLFSDLMGFVFAIAAGKVASMPGSRNYVSRLLTNAFNVYGPNLDWLKSFRPFLYRPSVIVVGKSLRLFFQC
jgi:hypothetical protein